MGTGIKLTQGERMMILLYGTNTRRGSIEGIQTVMRQLEPDETELRTLMTSTVHKLQRISDATFEGLNLFL